jgi:hypothetical protein
VSNDTNRERSLKETRRYAVRERERLADGLKPLEPELHDRWRDGLDPDHDVTS